MSSVDVIIPCYRYGTVLPFAVRSVLDQPGVDVRVLIIDDASPDDSADVARSLADGDPRVSCEVHRTNKGHIATYNEGLLDWAKADYSVLLSADDALTPGALSRAAALLDAHPEVGFAYGRPIHWDGSEPPPAARTRSRGWLVTPGQRWLQRRFATANGCITSPEVVVRTSLQQQVGGYDPELPHSGDIEMWMRFAAHADVGYLRDVDQAYYRVHGSNMSVSFYGDDGIRDLRQRLRAYDSTIEKVGHLIPDADRLRRRVHRNLGRAALQRAGRAYDKGRTATANVDGLVDFARDATGGDPASLPEWRWLQGRRRMGPATAARLGRLAAPAYGRAVRDRVRALRWRRTGS